MTDRRTRIVVVLDAVIVDDEWTMQDLRDNAAIYIGSIIQRAEEDERNDDSTYRLETGDITVFAEEDYVKDLDELREAPEDVQQALTAINALPPDERWRVWYLDAPSNDE